MRETVKRISHCLSGRNVNTETSILVQQTGEANHTSTVNILDCHATRQFWVSWINEMVQVGEPILKSLFSETFD